jgi:alkylation response protein AidB-like acyl-CoA dehydrogenase
MLLQLTPDQEFLRETTDKFLAKEATAAGLRALRHDPDGFDRAYWRRGAELGWTSLLVSEAGGGGSVSGHGLVDLTLIAQEFGRHGAPGPLAAANLVARALGGDPEGAHGEVLAGIVDGSIVAAWALEEGPGSPLGRPDLRITADGGDLVLDGLKRPVEAGAQADYLLVTGRDGDGLTQVLVPAGTPGVSVNPLQSVDLTRRLAAVSFEGARLPAAAAVGERGGATAAVSRLLWEALVVNAAESVGAMEAGFEMTVAWAFDRYSFGRPLASYQALKHRFADMKSWLEAAHAITDAAARAVDTDGSEAADLASAAKAYTGHYGAELLQDCVQLHGGIGVTFEHDLHIFLRRLTLDRMLYGTPADHRRILGRRALEGDGK